MTIDNATNNDSIIPLIQECIHSSFPCETAHFYIRSVAYILNLIVKDGLLKLIDPIVKLLRDNVKYIDSSTVRTNRFRDFVS